ncbi:unnamed protein product [Vitrella brassicaformis CCMP3155]|uniref:Tyrosine-protein kinase ephrin type A/B receptor-like domain-containing protein n=4 Tax=Vitrella brassicaformis TaxID=1169539 RepID=A0A0G4EEC8_VITBC|nr:unnamed protein product [Vitrella brassicaformis CCMP3155]|eukprot:CEL93707.1 unnamed protein product [Vitrella brassicaformis CCMP3155]
MPGRHCLRCLVLPLLCLWLGWTAAICRGQCLARGSRTVAEREGLNTNGTLRLAKRAWLSHQIVTEIFAAVVRDVVGIPVKLVDLSRIPASHMWEDMARHTDSSHSHSSSNTNSSPFPLYDIDLEQWNMHDTLDTAYVQHVLNDKTVVDAGSIGYPGKEGIFFPRRVLSKGSFVDYWRSHQEGGGAWKLFTRRSNGSLQFYPTDKPKTFVPRHCKGASGRSSCSDLYALPSGDGHTVLEDLVTALSLHYNVVYLPKHSYREHIEKAARQRQPILFYWWQPDEMTISTSAMPLTLPPHNPSCFPPSYTRLGGGGSGHSNNGSSGSGSGALKGSVSASCDWPSIHLKKAASRRVRAEMPMVLKALEAFTVSEKELTDMMKKVVIGGEHVSSVACQWVEGHKYTISGWLPDCASRGKMLDPSTLKCGFKCRTTRANTHNNSSSSSGVWELCQRCGAGRDLTIDGCRPCAPGTYRSGSLHKHTHQTHCTKCPMGMYSGRPGATQCRPCPKGTFAGEEGLSQCSLCPEGTYNDLQGAHHCIPCPRGASCVHRSEREVPHATKGHYRLTATTRTTTNKTDTTTSSTTASFSLFVPCPHAPDCSAANTCTPNSHTQGTLCTTCTKGHWRPSVRRPCVRCSSGGWVAVKVLLFLLQCGGLVWGLVHLVRGRERESGGGGQHGKDIKGNPALPAVVKVVSSYLELTSVAVAALSPAVRSAYSSLYVLQWVSDLADPLKNMLDFGCWFGTPIGSLRFTLVLAFVFPPAAVLTGLLLVHAFSVDHVTPQWLKQKFQHKTTTAVLVALLLFSPTATHQYVVALHCRSYASVYGPPVAHSGGARDAAKAVGVGVFDEPARLVYDPDTFCYGGEQTPYFVLALLGLILWSVGMPLLFLMLTIYLPSTTADAAAAPSKRRRLFGGLFLHLDFLWYGYRPAMRGWECYVMLRKVVVWVVLLVPPGPRSTVMSESAQAYALLLLQGLAFIALHSWARPHDVRPCGVQDRLESQCLWTFLATVTAMLLLTSSSIVGSPGSATGWIVTLAVLSLHFRFIASALSSLRLDAPFLPLRRIIWSETLRKRVTRFLGSPHVHIVGSREAVSCLDVRELKPGERAVVVNTLAQLSTDMLDRRVCGQYFHTKAVDYVVEGALEGWGEEISDQRRLEAIRGRVAARRTEGDVCSASTTLTLPDLQELLLSQPTSLVATQFSHALAADRTPPAPTSPPSRHRASTPAPTPQSPPADDDETQPHPHRHPPPTPHQHKRRARDKGGKRHRRGAESGCFPRREKPRDCKPCPPPPPDLGEVVIDMDAPTPTPPDRPTRPPSPSPQRKKHQDKPSPRAATSPAAAAATERKDPHPHPHQKPHAHAHGHGAARETGHEEAKKASPTTRKDRDRKKSYNEKEESKTKRGRSTSAERNNRDKGDKGDGCTPKPPTGDHKRSRSLERTERGRERHRGTHRGKSHEQRRHSSNSNSREAAQSQSPPVDEPITHQGRRRSPPPRHAACAATLEPPYPPAPAAHPPCTSTDDEAYADDPEAAQDPAAPSSTTPTPPAPPPAPAAHGRTPPARRRDDSTRRLLSPDAKQKDHRVGAAPVTLLDPSYRSPFAPNVMMMHGECHTHTHTHRPPMTPEDKKRDGEGEGEGPWGEREREELAAFFRRTVEGFDFDEANGTDVSEDDGQGDSSCLSNEFDEGVTMITESVKRTERALSNEERARWILRETQGGGRR